MLSICEDAMKIINIPSRAIPWLSDDIKSTINSGDWLLFTSIDEDDANYFLDIGQKILRINDHGIIEEISKVNFSLSISQIIYFSDIRKPDSMSNMKVSYY